MGGTQHARSIEGKEEMPQATRLDDVRIREVRPLISPALLQYELPADAAVQEFIEASRDEVARVVHANDPRLLVVVGPCSIHDREQALEYAGRLKALSAELRDDLLRSAARRPHAVPAGILESRYQLRDGRKIGQRA